MKFNEDEFKKNWDSGLIPTINLNRPAKVANNDLITIFQHPLGGEIAFSQSNCRVIGELVSSYSSIAKYFPLNQLTKQGDSVVAMYKSIHS